jgi:phytoene synthase
VKQATRASYDSIRRHSKSFSLASRLLPAEARHHAVSVYAWCRRADDAVDLAPSEVQPAALKELGAELREVYTGRGSDDAVLDAFRETVEERSIPIEYPLDLLAGLKMDVRGHRYDSMYELLEYCYYVAGCVGLMMCHVMGVKDERALRNAAHLGMAMQLTNICRDVEEDWRRGRLYIPEAVLERHGAPRLADGLGGTFPRHARDSIGAAVSELLDVADRYYASGDEGLPALSSRCAMAIRGARLVYSAIGGRIRRVRCDPLAGRAIVPFPHKLVLMARAATASVGAVPTRILRPTGRSPAPPSAVARFPHDVLPLAPGFRADHA